MTPPDLDIQSLSADARLDLIEALWSSLDDRDVPMSDVHRRELDRRIDAPDRATWKLTSAQALAERLNKPIR